MTNIKEFMEVAKEEFRRMIPMELTDNMEIEETTVTKVNDQVLHGLAVKIKGEESAPTIYMDEAYKRFMSGEETLKSLMTQAVQEYLDAIVHKPDSIIEKFDFDAIKDNLTVRLVEVKRNIQYLSDVPYMLVGNGFAYVCDIKVNTDMEGYWKTTVTRSLMENEGYDKKELFSKAIEGSCKNDPATLRSMEETLFGFDESRDYFSDDAVIDPDEQDQMYILSTADGTFGATVMYYPEVKEKIAEKLGEGYYAIPSSLHEFLIVPESAGMDPADLGRMVYEANHNVVDAKDVLSDDILHYDKNTRTLETIPNELTKGEFDCERAC